LPDSAGPGGRGRRLCDPEPMAEPARHDATRRSYDAVAEKYAASFRDELAYKPLDRALLTCLIEQAGQDGPIADLGCGPGHVSAWLSALR